MVPAVRDVASAAVAAVEIVAGVELHAGLRGVHLHHASTPRLVDAGGEARQRGRLPDGVVVVVAARIPADALDPVADRGGPGEVHRRSDHWGELAGRDRLGVDRQVVIGRELELVIEYVAGTAVAKVRRSAVARKSTQSASRFVSV